MNERDISMESKVVRLAVEKRLADIAGSGGLNYDRVGLELLYLLPQDFVDVYVELFHKALAGADGGSGARGEAGANTGALGRASGKRRTGDRSATGGRTGAMGRAARSTGKKYRKIWIVRDERALDVKERADKRLRQLAREIKLQVSDREDRAGERRSRRSCPTCKRFTDIEWRFCPTCGARIEED